MRRKKGRRRVWLGDAFLARFARNCVKEAGGRTDSAAYTDHHGIYMLQPVPKQRFQILMFYDRDASSWKPVNDEKYPLSYRLLGVDRNDLVMWDRSIDPTLMWFPAPQ